jgi:cytochrome c biogenesis factor
MSLDQIYIALVVTLLLACTAWFVRDAHFRKREAAAPMVVAGCGVIVLTFVYLLVAIVLNDLSS